MPDPMIPRERADYSAIVDRPPLKLPGGARFEIDFRLRQSDFRADGQRTGIPWLGMPIVDVGKQIVEPARLGFRQPRQELVDSDFDGNLFRREQHLRPMFGGFCSVPDGHLELPVCL